MGVASRLPVPGFPPWAVVTRERQAHVDRVAALVDGWATTMGVSTAERTRWLKAVWLHDALRDATAADLAALVSDPLGATELWHGPAAAERASQEGEDDAGVLDAVRYHSLGYHAWDRVGKVLYSADFLDPGRSFDREERAALASQFPEAPDSVLVEVARRRLVHLVGKGLPIHQPTWDFWNTLVGS